MPRSVMEVPQTMATETKPTTATHTVCHVEIPAKDREKLLGFYGGLFGWQFQSMPDMPTYHMGMMAAGDSPCGVAIYTPEAGDPTTIVRNYISVESIGDYTKRLEELGGKVHNRFTVSGMGFGAVCTDPEGNDCSLWEQNESAKE